MGLKDVFESLACFFKDNDMDYAVIGAFALYSYGYVRATNDIDFITRIENKNSVVKYLESLGFETIFDSNAFSNHLHPVGQLRVDIMYVEGSTADKIFKSVQNRIFFNKIKFPVASTEHLVAMKLFAIQNNPERKHKDFGDIKEILNNSSYDKDKIKEYFIKYGQEAFYDEITKKQQ